MKRHNQVRNVAHGEKCSHPLCLVWREKHPEPMTKNHPLCFGEKFPRALGEKSPPGLLTRSPAGLAARSPPRPQRTTSGLARSPPRALGEKSPPSRLGEEFSEHLSNFGPCWRDVGPVFLMQ